MNKKEILKEVFGYDSFRAGQEQVVDSILNKKDTMAIMPTGAGKSICFQVPALLFEGITIVVSPLISLMLDQVRALNEAGVHAAYINSSLTETQISKALEFARTGRYKIIYVAPERLTTANFLDAVQDMNIEMLAVDEAHCISQWGQNFRPSYLNIVEFVKQLKKRPVVAAFTATATKVVQSDIKSILELHSPSVFLTGYDRSNLFFGVESHQDRMRALRQYIRKNDGKSGIIYCNTRKAVDEICEKLLEEDFSITKYHAGLSENERKENQTKFIYDEIPLMVATNAFGMGIDKSNIRFIVHYNMPKDMESYYQEAGRAGRDGLDSECILYYAGQDVRMNEFLISKQNEQNQTEQVMSDEDREAVHEKELERLKKMTFYSTTSDCLRGYILKYFGENAPSYCGTCSNCLSEFEEVDITNEAIKIIKLVGSSGGRFGVTVIAEAIHGSKTERIKNLSISRNNFYGCLANTSIARIRQIINELIMLDYLYTTRDQYPVLKLTETTTNMTQMDFEELSITGKFPIANNRVMVESKKAKKSKERQEYLGAKENVFEMLRMLRMEIARRAKVPPYIIFADKTLMEMSIYMPITKEEMLEINGVGNVKYNKYGEEFLEAIRNWKDSH